MDLPTVVLKPKEDARLRSGHLWAFSNEVAQAPADLAPGALADLATSSGVFLGRGFYHPHSLIAFRVLSGQREEIDAAFFARHLSQALAIRERLYPGTRAYRWVFGESDHLPGLVVDRYGDYLVLEVLSAGMERFKDVIVEDLKASVAPKGIVWRPDAPLRVLEGLPEGPPEVAWGTVPPRVQITLENGVFAVDLLTGQKTGFYFDQRDNRQALTPLCAGKRVLDAFCYSGGFGIAAARAVAKQVVFVDSSHAALELAADNAALNHVAERCEFVEGDALQLLARASDQPRFDVICIDPPAYARSRKHLPVALKAYEKLNILAMTALPAGGILATSSCSHHVDREMFLQMLRRSARRARRSLRVLELCSQAKDHPILLAMPETEYLKFAILQVI
jgi:23S rRNA (cytosine1962-C5)-methyltransferase